MRKFIREESSIGKLILLIGMLLAVPLLALPVLSGGIRRRSGFSDPGGVFHFAGAGDRLPYPS